MEPEVRYCMTTDGVRIAYTVTGSGPPVIQAPEPPASHVQQARKMPVISEIVSELERHFTLVSFDFRSTGLSDRRLPGCLEDLVRDIEAVVERTGLTRFSMIGTQNSSPAAIQYAGHNPDRIERFVTWDGYARYRDLLATPQAQAIFLAARLDWVVATEAMGTTVFGAGREESRHWGTFIRSCIGQEWFSEEFQSRIADFDASDAARKITAPTLILKHQGVEFVTMEMTRDLAALIPNSQVLVLTETWADDPAGLARRTAEFLGASSSASSPAPMEAPAGTAIILFADIVDSTRLTEQLGDAAFRDRARQLDDAMRSAIKRSNGTAIEGKLLGDGVLAVFTGARDAISAAIACRDAAQNLGLELHLGLHAGDIIREANNVYGGAVNIAARIAAASAPGELLVSQTVRDLARTSAGVTFEDHGEQQLKGIDEPVRVWAVR
jgi:class 3 adenylate cyclase